MVLNTSRRQEQFRWKVFIFFWASFAFVLGYIFGLISSVLNENPASGMTGNLDSPRESTLNSKNIFAFLTVGILTSPRNGLRRKVIRETWLSKKTAEDIHHVFVLGTSGLNDVKLAEILKEQEQHNDLLLLQDLPDSYQLLTKKVLTYFLWLSKNINFSFVLKVDDDSFVQLVQLYTELTERQVKSKVYWGFFDGRARVKQRGKWAEKKWILCDRFLPYAQGGGYVLSSDLVNFIARNEADLQIYSNEDVSVGTWIAPLKVRRFHDPRFDTEFESRGCFNTYLITHKQSPEEMKNKFANLKKIGVMCNPEFRNKKSYLYDWDVPPSLCCIRNNSKVP